MAPRDELAETSELQPCKMTSQSSSSNINFRSSDNEFGVYAALHTPGVTEHREDYQLTLQRCSPIPNVNWDPQVCLHETYSNNTPSLSHVNLGCHMSSNTSSGCDLKLNTRKSPSENISLDQRLDYSIQRSNCERSLKHQPCDTVGPLKIKDSPEGLVSSLEGSLHFSSPYLADNTNNLFSSRHSSSLRGENAVNNCTEDSGFGCYDDESFNNSSRVPSVSAECNNLCCQETALANRRLKRELLELKMKLDVKDASLARLKDAITKQYVEKEDIIQLKIQSESDLRACERQLETSRKSEDHFRENLYQSTAELNALRRENFLLQGEMTSSKILTRKLHAEKLQNNKMPSKHFLRDKVAPTETPSEHRYQELLVPPLEEKVLQLEKQMEKLQDDTEDLEFKAQRHEEEAASLCSQNTQLVKKCSDLQRQLVESLSAVDVLHVRCNDAESKLERARQALEEKETALHALSGEHTESLVKIEENEREMENVRTEMDNVTRNFVKISLNQRELKEDLLFYKNVLETRDHKIKQLTEERKGILSLLEELKERVHDKDKIDCKDVVQTNFPEELKSSMRGKGESNLKGASVQTNFPEELKDRILGKDVIGSRDAGVQISFPEELEDRMCVKDNIGGIDAVVQTNFPEPCTKQCTELSLSEQVQVRPDCPYRFDKLDRKDAAVDAMFPLIDTKDAAVDAMFPLMGTMDAAVDAMFPLMGTKDAAVDAIFPLMSTKDAAVDAMFPLMGTMDAAVDAMFPLMGTKDAAVDAIFPLMGTKDAAVDVMSPRIDIKDAAVDAMFPQLTKKVAAVQTIFPEQLPEPWAEQCTELLESIAIGDSLMTGQVRCLKLENDRLVAKVESLNNELENRCAASVFRMTEVMETIEQLECDMNQFLSTVDQKPPKTAEVPQKTEYEMMRELADMRETSQALRRANLDLEEQLKKQTFWLDAVLQSQEAGARQAAREKLADLKISAKSKIPIDLSDKVVAQAATKSAPSVENQQVGTNRLSFETKAVILENANNELITYIDSLHKFVAQSTSAEPPGGQYLKNSSLVLQPVDLLNVPQLSLNVFDELYRISVFLQVCLLKTRTIIPEDRDGRFYLPILSGLESLLLNVRSAMSSNGSVESSYPLPNAESGLSEAEPNILIASKTELEIQLSAYQKNNNMLREALAVSEEKRKKEEKRHKIQLYDLIQKFKLRLKEKKSNVSTCTTDPAKNGNQSVQDTSFESDHRVCTDMVVNLKRNLRASESANIEVQKQLRAKTEETWRLCQEITNLRSSLEAVNDILDNKKIALGRSEAMGQMLKVSEASLGQRLEQEQRQHEDCRQQLDKLAASLQETRNYSQDIKVLRRQLLKKEQKLAAVYKDYNNATKEQKILMERCKERDRELEQMRNELEEGIISSNSSAPSMEQRGDFRTEAESESVTCLLPSPPPIRNRAEILNLIERAKLPRSDMMPLLHDCVSRMSENLSLLQHHLQDSRRDNPSA